MALVKNSFWLFLVFVFVAMVLPFVLGIFVMGTHRIGFPLRFYERTSAPPPATGSMFAARAFVVDLLIYFAGAVAVLLLWQVLKRAFK
jgi:hypothetical protein